MRNLIFGVKNVRYKKGKKSVTTGQVAIWNEYGTETAPPRPAFRMGLEHAVEANKKMIEAQLKNITRQILTGRTADIDKAVRNVLTQIGRSAKSKTVQIIAEGSTTQNAPSTIARKGFDHPLYETGLLMESVDYEVTE